MKNNPLSIPGYEILEKIGEGGMGTVFKAHQISLDRMVAVKTLPPRFAEKKDYIEHLQAEAQIEATLRHTNLIQVYEAGQSNGVFYFIMEYVAGYTVAHLLERHGKLGVEDVFAIAESVAVALSYAWEKARIIHGDIKPGNIMIDNDGMIKIGDFLPLGQLDEEGSPPPFEDHILGTLNYMPPEQMMGEPQLDDRTDIYALGALMYHLVTGQLPFAGLDAEGACDEHMEVYLPDITSLVPDAPPRLVWLIDKMLVRDRAFRYAGWESFLKDLDLVRGGKMPSSPMPEEGSSAMLRSPERIEELARQPVKITVNKTPKAKIKLRKKKVEEEIAPHAAESKLQKTVAGGGVFLAIALMGIVFLGGFGEGVDEKEAWPPPVVAPDLVEAFDPPLTDEVAGEVVVKEPVVTEISPAVEKGKESPVKSAPEEEFFGLKEKEPSAARSEWTDERASAFQGFTLLMRNVGRLMEQKSFVAAGELLDSWLGEHPGHAFFEEVAAERSWVALAEQLMAKLFAEKNLLRDMELDDGPGKVGSITDLKDGVLRLSKSFEGGSRVTADVPLTTLSDEAFIKLIEAIDTEGRLRNKAIYYLAAGKLDLAEEAIDKMSMEGGDITAFNRWFSSQLRVKDNVDAYKALAACLQELRKGDAQEAEEQFQDAEIRFSSTDVFLGGGRVQIEKVKEAISSALAQSAD